MKTSVLMLGALLLYPTLLQADPGLGPPAPQNILIISGPESVTNTVYVLSNLPWLQCPEISDPVTGLRDGPTHNVSTTATVPPIATLQTYDEVWDMRFDYACASSCPAASLTAAIQTEYQQYLQGGGSLFLMGDNGGYMGRDQGIIDFTQSVMASGTFGPSVWAVDSPWAPNFAACTTAENFAIDYRVLTDTAKAGQASGLMHAMWTGYITSWGSGQPVMTVQGDATEATAIAFRHADLKAPYTAGKLFVQWDWQETRDQYCGTDGYANSIYIENVADFLAVPTPTATSTPSATDTPPFSPTDTGTPTQTATGTRTGTPTFSGTPTDSPTITQTLTGSMTSTPSRTRTQTVTSSETVTPSLTLTPSLTPIPTIGVPYIYPQPIIGTFAHVAYTMPEPGTVKILIYNAAADLVEKVEEQKDEGNQDTRLELYQFSHGVYYFIVRFTYISGRQESIKPQGFIILR